MDPVTLGGAFFEIAVAVGVIYLLRKQRFRITLGIGGSLLLLGLTLLGVAYGVISGSHCVDSSNNRLSTFHRFLLGRSARLAWPRACMN